MNQNCVMLSGIVKFNPIFKTNECGKNFASFIIMIKEPIAIRNGAVRVRTNQQRVIAFEPIGSAIMDEVKEGDAISVVCHVANFSKMVMDQRKYYREIVLDHFVLPNNRTKAKSTILADEDGA